MPEWAWNASAVLVGAIIGALVAGYVAWMLERRRLKWQHDKEMKTFAAALRVELELLIIALREASEQEDPLQAIVKLSEFRHSTHVLLGNTDKIGLLGEENARSFIAAYGSVFIWMREGENFERELNHVKYLPDKVDKLRSEAAEYQPRFAQWVETAEKLHDQIGELTR